jgi:peptidyl-prolyl cis-trans isomerase C
MGIAGKLFATAAVVMTFTTTGFAQEAPTRETVVATVNGTEITLGHVLSLASRLPSQYMGIPDKELYAGIVEQLVQQELLSSLITEQSAELKLAGENEKRALFASEAIQEIYTNALTEEAIKEQYDTLYGKAAPVAEYLPSHILVKTEEEAKEIARLIEDGGDFVELAKEKSTGPSGPQGGVLGWVGKGELATEFEEAMVALDINQVSAPVKTSFGWHVIKLLEKRDRPAPALEEVQEGIEDGLKTVALDKKIAELEASGQIKRNEQEIDPSFVKKFELLED